MNRKRKIVITNFYANGKCVWIAERPVPMTEEEIRRSISDIDEMGYGKVEAVTDTNGRMLKFD